MCFVCIEWIVLSPFGSMSRFPPSGPFLWEVIKQPEHVSVQINVRQNRRGNTGWTIQRHMQHWAQATEKKPTT